MDVGFHLHALVDVITTVSDQPYHSRYEVLEWVFIAADLLVGNIAHHDGAVAPYAEIGVCNVWRRLHNLAVGDNISVTVSRGHAEVSAVGRQFATALSVAHRVQDSTPCSEEPRFCLLASSS